MPRPAKVANAFPPKEAADIVGLTPHMINYLARESYLVPTYGQSGTRGRTRYYSYRDLVVARIIKDLLDAGVELSGLRSALSDLQTHARWTAGNATTTLGLLVTDGTSLFFPEDDAELLDLSARGRLRFAFVLDVGRAIAHVKDHLTPEQLAHYDLANRRRIAVPADQTARGSASM